MPTCRQIDDIVKRRGFSMKRFLIVLLSLSFLSTNVSIAAVKVGSTCSVKGQIKTVSGYKYTCIKSGKKLVWNKIVVIKPTPKPSVTPTPTPTPTIISDPTGAVGGTTTIAPKPLAFEYRNKCEADPDVPSQWKQFQENQIKSGWCSTPLRYVKKSLSDIKPITIQDDESKYLNVKECKLPIGNGWQRDEDSNFHMHPNLVIQVVPFSTPDYEASTNPQDDYRDYFTFIRQSLEDMTDGPSNYKFVIPNKYFKIGKTLVSYDVGVHENLEAEYGQRNLARDVIAVADPEIDFKNADRIWIMGPPNATNKVLHNWGGGGWTSTKEKEIPGIYINTTPYSYGSKGWNGRGPFGDLHELMHTTSSTLYDHETMQGWGNMSGASMDFLAWDKWTAKFISDSQVKCASSSVTTTTWIKPSTASGQYEKLLLIKLSSTKVIAIESIRNTGFNFKLPNCEQGVLIYTVDVTTLSQETGKGLDLVTGASSNAGCKTGTFKAGESTVYDGIKISILESGDFGDVVKVEKP